MSNSFKKTIKKIAPVILLFLFVSFFLFRETFTKGFVPVPADTLVGSYFPWLDYKWGYQVGVPVKNPPISDVFSQFFVWKYQLIEIYKQGFWPLWNSHSFSGTPLLATYHSTALFPANLLFLLPRFWGWSLYIALSTFTAAVGMYLFTRNWLKSKPARLVAAVIFSLAGPMTTWSEFGTGVWAAAMLPFILFLVDQIILHRKDKLFPLVSLLTTLLLLAGHAQLDTYAAILVPAYILFRLTSTPIKNKLPILLKFAFFGVLGVGLAAIQLLPTLDFQSISIRGEENYASGFNFGLTPIFEVLRLWAADFFGHPVTYNHFSPTSYHEYSSFLSTLSLPFILSLLFVKKNKFTKFFLSIFIITLVLAIENPLSKLVFSLPIPLLTYSSASRLLFITVLSSAVLVPTSFRNLNSFKYRKLLSATSLILITITFLAVLSVSPPNRLVALRNSILPISLLISLILLLQVRLKTNITILILLVLFSFDLGRYFRKYNPQVSSHLVFPTTPAIDFLKNQSGTFRTVRQRGPLMPPNTWSYYGLESIEGYDPLRLLNYNHYFRLLENKSYLGKPSRYSELESINPKFLDASNVKYYVAIKEAERPYRPMVDILLEHGYKPVFQDKSVEVLENPHVLSRAYFVDTLIKVKDEKDLIEKVEEQGFDPRTTAIILGPNSDQLELAKGEVLNIIHQPNTVTVNLVLEEPGFLVLSDAFSPGWQATIDGQATDVHQVNGGVRGVFVPAGNHQLVFNYLPQSFVLGAKISLVSLTILIFSLIYYAYYEKTIS
jgi:hypothetical protein